MGLTPLSPEAGARGVRIGRVYQVAAVVRTRARQTRVLANAATTNGHPHRVRVSGRKQPEGWSRSRGLPPRALDARPSGRKTDPGFQTGSTETTYRRDGA